MTKAIPWLREHANAVIAGTLAVLAFATSLVTLVTGDPGLREDLTQHLPAAILALLATCVLFTLFEYHGRFSSILEKVSDFREVVQGCPSVELVRELDELGVKKLSVGREDNGRRPGYLNLLRSAAEELFIVGLTLKGLTREHRPARVARFEAGCSIRLALLTPLRWRKAEPTLDPVEEGDLRAAYPSAIHHRRALAKDLGRAGGRAVPAGSFEVRFYDPAPALSLTVADGGSGRGRMRAEFTPHNETTLNQHFRPMMDLAPAHSRANPSGSEVDDRTGGTLAAARPSSRGAPQAPPPHDQPRNERIEREPLRGGE